jgi:hypothetical protein
VEDDCEGLPEPGTLGSPRVRVPGLAALAPDLARTDKTMKGSDPWRTEELQRGILPFMPGRRAADEERFRSDFFNAGRLQSLAYYRIERRERRYWRAREIFSCAVSELLAFRVRLRPTSFSRRQTPDLFPIFFETLRSGDPLSSGLRMVCFRALLTRKHGSPSIKCGYDKRESALAVSKRRRVSASFFSELRQLREGLWKNLKKLFLSVDIPIGVPYTHQVLRNATLLDRGGYCS